MSDLANIAENNNIIVKTFIDLFNKINENFNKYNSFINTLIVLLTIYFQYEYCLDAEKFYNINAIYFITNDFFRLIYSMPSVIILIIFVLNIKLILNRIYPEQFFYTLLVNTAFAFLLYTLFKSSYNIPTKHIFNIILFIVYLLVIIFLWLEHKEFSAHVEIKKGEINFNDREISNFIYKENEKLIKTLKKQNKKIQNSRILKDIKGLNNNIAEKFQEIVSATIVAFSTEVNSLLCKHFNNCSEVINDNNQKSKKSCSVFKNLKNIIICFFENKLVHTFIFCIIPIVLVCILFRSIINNELYFENKKYEIIYSKNFDYDSIGIMVDVVILHKDSHIITMKGSISNNKLNIYNDFYELKDAYPEQCELCSFSHVKSASRLKIQGINFKKFNYCKYLTYYINDNISDPKIK